MLRQIASLCPWRHPRTRRQFPCRHFRCVHRWRRRWPRRRSRHPLQRRQRPRRQVGLRHFRLRRIRPGPSDRQRPWIRPRPRFCPRPSCPPRRWIRRIRPRWRLRLLLSWHRPRRRSVLWFPRCRPSPLRRRRPSRSSRREPMRKRNAPRYGSRGLQRSRNPQQANHGFLAHTSLGAIPCPRPTRTRSSTWVGFGCRRFVVGTVVGTTLGIVVDGAVGVRLP